MGMRAGLYVLDMEDGEFPEICNQLTLSSGTDEAVVRQMLENLGGKESRDITFLTALARARVESPEILTRLFSIREQIVGGERVSAVDFVMLTQRLRFLNFSKGLNISRNMFGEGLDLRGLLVGGNLYASGIGVRGDLDMRDAVIMGNNVQEDASITGDVRQDGVRVIGMNDQARVEVGGSMFQNTAYFGGLNIQAGLTVKGDFSQNEAQVDGANFQNSLRVGGGLTQERMVVGARENGGDNNQTFFKVAGDNVQRSMRIGGSNIQSYGEIGGDNWQEGMEMFRNDQEGLVVHGATVRDNMNVLHSENGRFREFRGGVRQEGISIGSYANMRRLVVEVDEVEADHGDAAKEAPVAASEVGIRGRMRRVTRKS